MRDFDQRSLARRLCDRDRDAPKDILAAFGGKLAGRLHARHKDLLPADMATQAVLLAVERACRTPPISIQPKGPWRPLEAWLWRIVKREAARIIGADWCQERLHETSVAQEELADLAFAPADDFDEEDWAERDPQMAEFLHYLRLAMPAVSENEEYILYANACSSVGTAPTEQLAAELGLDESTIRRIRAEGPRKLKNEMERLGYAGPPKRSATARRTDPPRGVTASLIMAGD